MAQVSKLGFTVDPAAVARLADAIGAENLPEMLDVILQSTPASRDELQAAAAESNAKQLECAAHKLKSDCTTLGAVELAAQLQELEQSAREGRLSDCAAEVSVLAAHLDTLITDVGVLRSRQNERF